MPPDTVAETEAAEEHERAYQEALRDPEHRAFVAERIERLRRGTSRELSIVTRAKAALAGVMQRPEGVGIADFWHYAPMNQFIFAPCRELWPAASVNHRLGDRYDREGKPAKAAAVLAQERSVDQMTWAPGEAAIIPDRLVAGGGWIERSGCRVFNLYLPPAVEAGDPDDAGFWLEHVKRVYPGDADHIVDCLAHKVQRPAEKLNHAIVLGGKQGIGKDTLLEPVKYAIGPWNFAEVSPANLLGRFNPFIKSVILRVSEARDLGDVDRFAFYDHMKVYTAAPPDVLRCDEKNIREHAVLNVCTVIITTNHKADGIYLPADDRRHYVAWSERDRTDFEPDYWTRLYGWFAAGGSRNVAAYLAKRDLSHFDPKAPPPKTTAFWDIVDANRSPEDAELADVLDNIGNPPAITLARLADSAGQSFREWLTDRRNRRQIPHRLESAGYIPVRNSAAKDGLWKVSGRRQAVYALATLVPRDRIVAAQELT